MSAKDAKNAKRAKKTNDVLLASLSFAFFASFADNSILSNYLRYLWREIRLLRTVVQLRIEQ